MENKREPRAGAEIGTANVDVRESERCRNREGCCGKYTIYSEASTSAQTAFKVKSNSCSVLKITALCTESLRTHRDGSARQRSHFCYISNSEKCNVAM